MCWGPTCQHWWKAIDKLGLNKNQLFQKLCFVELGKKTNCPTNCITGNGKIKQIVQPIVVCGMGKKKQGQNQLCFVKLGKKRKGKTNGDEGNCKEKSRTKQLWKKKLSFQLLFVGIGRKKQWQNQVQRCWKEIKEITSKE